MNFCAVGSEEIGRVMAVRKSKWEVEEVESDEVAQSKQSNESIEANEGNGYLLSDESDDDGSLQGITQ